MERSQRDLLSVLQSLFFLFISAASRTKKPGWDPGSCMSQDGRASPAPVLEASSVGEGGVGWGMPSGSPPSILFLNSQVIIIIIIFKKNSDRPSGPTHALSLHPPFPQQLLFLLRGYLWRARDSTSHSSCRLAGKSLRGEKEKKKGREKEAGLRTWPLAAKAGPGPGRTS